MTDKRKSRSRAEHTVSTIPHTLQSSWSDVRARELDRELSRAAITYDEVATIGQDPEVVRAALATSVAWDTAIAILGRATRASSTQRLVLLALLADQIRSAESLTAELLNLTADRMGIGRSRVLLKEAAKIADIFVND